MFRISHGPSFCFFTILLQSNGFFFCYSGSTDYLSVLLLAFCSVSLLFLVENHSHMSVSVVLMSKHIFFVSLSASMHVYASAYVIQCLGLDAYGCNNYVFFCQKFVCLHVYLLQEMICDFKS